MKKWDVFISLGFTKFKKSYLSVQITYFVLGYYIVKTITFNP